MSKVSPPPRYDVLGVCVHAVDPGAVVETIGSWIEGGGRGYVCFTNVHSVMEAAGDPALQAVYNQADLCVPDGMPVVWAGRLSGFEGVRRVYGPDLTLAMCAEAARRGWPCFFYGGRAGVADRLAAALTSRFPGLRVAGAESPPFGPLERTEDPAALARINDSGASIVFVGLGCPKQERWMAAHRGALRAPALLGVGAAFDLLTGDVPQAPRWMMGMGLEWSYRLWQEPRRLWHRYLVYNPLFLMRFAWQRLSRRHPHCPR
jgi:N-acetylglucosaminyldiphosphoundecaprenol N-acetyl-beta-D-mannosaminyltransferase